MTTLLPGYPAVMAAVKRARALHAYDSLLGQPARLLAGKLGDQPLIVLDAPAFFDRPGGPYADPLGRDWDDNWRRFAALGRAAAPDAFVARRAALAPYRIDDAQVIVPPTAAARKGVQPVVELTANGKLRADIEAGVQLGRMMAAAVLAEASLTDGPLRALCRRVREELAARHAQRL